MHDATQSQENRDLNPHVLFIDLITGIPSITPTLGFLLFRVDFLAGEVNRPGNEIYITFFISSL